MFLEWARGRHCHLSRICRSENRFPPLSLSLSHSQSIHLLTRRHRRGPRATRVISCILLRPSPLLSSHSLLLPSLSHDAALLQEQKWNDGKSTTANGTIGSPANGNALSLSSSNSVSAPSASIYSGMNMYHKVAVLMVLWGCL